MFKVWQTRTQRNKQEKAKEKCKLGICAIKKQITGRQGTPIIGAGCLVKDFFPEFERKHHLVTCAAVINSDNLEGYFLYFQKLDLSDKKGVQLASVVNKADKIFRTSDVVFIPLDPGKLKSRSGLLNDRPFRKGIQHKGFKLYCQVVEEYGTSHVVRPFQLLENENEEYSLPEFPPDSYRKLLGAPITTDLDGEPVVVGVLTSGNKVSPIFFSQLDIASSATRGDKQVNSGSTASADGATASASSSQRGKQPRNLNEQDNNNANNVQQPYADEAGTRKGSPRNTKTENEGASKFKVAIKGCSGPFMFGDHNSLTIGSPNCESNANTVQQQYADEARARKGSAGNTKTENEGASKFDVAIERCSGPVMLGDSSSLTIASTPGDEQH